jgi:hypothetical protein
MYRFWQLLHSCLAFMPYRRPAGPTRLHKCIAFHSSPPGRSKMALGRAQAIRRRENDGRTTVHAVGEWQPAVRIIMARQNPHVQICLTSALQCLGPSTSWCTLVSASPFDATAAAVWLPALPATLCIACRERTNI